MRVYYFAMMEFENDGVSQEQGHRVIDAMNELKAAFDAIGKATFYQVAKGDEYRRVENEIKRSLNK